MKVTKPIPSSLFRMTGGAIFANGRGSFRAFFAMAALSIVLILPFQGCRELHQFSYPKLADATNSGEIARGWLPDFMPTTTHDIRIAYDPSSPMTWCAFQFSPGDSQRLRSHVTSPGALPSRVRHIEGSGLQWWPDFLTGNLDLAAIQNRGFNVYVVTEQDVGANTLEVLFVVDWQTGSGYFYRTAGG